MKRLKKHILTTISILLTAAFITPAGAADIKFTTLEVKFKLPPGWKSKKYTRGKNEKYVLSKRRVRLSIQVEANTAPSDLDDKSVWQDFSNKESRVYNIKAKKAVKFEPVEEKLSAKKFFSDVEYAMKRNRRRRYLRMVGLVYYGKSYISLSAKGNPRTIRRYKKDLKEIVDSIRFVEDQPKQEEKKDEKKPAAVSPGSYAATEQEFKFFE